MRHLLTFLIGFFIISANVSFADQGVPLEVVRVQAKSKMNNGNYPNYPSNYPSNNSSNSSPNTISKKASSSVYVDLPDAQSTPKNHYSAPRFSSTVFPGSLRENITRIARSHGWPQVVWQAPYDYKWTGTTQIQAGNLPELLSHVLAEYPLQAIFYEGNHVLLIAPRTI